MQPCLHENAGLLRGARKPEGGPGRAWELVTYLLAPWVTQYLSGDSISGNCSAVCYWREYSPVFSLTLFCTLDSGGVRE